MLFLSDSSGRWEEAGGKNPIIVICSPWWRLGLLNMWWSGGGFTLTRSSMTFLVIPQRKTSTVSLLMWVMSFPRGSHNDSAVHPPSAFWGSPIPPFLKPKGTLSGNVPLEVHPAGSFPHISNQVHPFHCCLWKWMLVPIQLLSSFLYHLRPIATVFRLLKF